MAEIISTEASSNFSAAVAAGLARLWVKFFPEIEQRLKTLEGAADALAAGTLVAVRREEAHAAAHKLAGILGTFGLQRGTELARQAELLLENDLSGDSKEFLRWATELRELVNAHNLNS